MRHAVVIFAIAALAAAVPAQGQPKEHTPRFADYPVTKLSHLRVAKPKVAASWHEQLRLRLQDKVDDSSRTNFAGRYFLAVVGCGTACVWSAIVEPKTGETVVLPMVSSWRDTHKKFKGVDFRHNSRLIVLSGERDDKEGDMGRHYYVFEDGTLRHLKTVATDGNFKELNK
jgi:hypothetical protein